MDRNLSCPRCGETLPVSEAGNRQNFECPACHAEVEAFVFPAFQNDPAAQPHIEVAQESEAVCFFHPRYRALRPCDQCGRFLCQLCTIHVGQRKLCAECLAQLRKQKTETGLIHHAALFDNTALFLVIAPAVTIALAFLTIISAPAALFLSIYYWPRQWTLLRRSRLRFGVAGLLSVLALAGWAILVYDIVTSYR
ncbi:MAG TPA: hypothetical protein VE860_16310 [Chthoniobacterales bacterium]|nr:hypothetical protein [Chthoniobacterales bacterium]